MALLNFPLPLSQFMLSVPVVEMSFDLSEAMAADETGRGEVLTAALGARLWGGTVTVARRRLDLAGQYSVLVDLLRQPGASFYIGDLARRFPAADPSGLVLGPTVPTLATVSGDQREVTLAGLPAGYVLGPGDFIAFDYGTSPLRRALHRVVHGGGAASAAGVSPALEVVPPIRAGFAVGAAVTLVDPACKAVLVPGSATPSRSRRALGDGLAFSFLQTLG
jgi:hypothetical protein